VLTRCVPSVVTAGVAEALPLRKAVAVGVGLTTVAEGFSNDGVAVFPLVGAEVAVAEAGGAVAVGARLVLVGEADVRVGSGIGVGGVAVSVGGGGAVVALGIVNHAEADSPMGN
jgi:hypothetical protein